MSEAKSPVQMAAEEHAGRYYNPHDGNFVPKVSEESFLAGHRSRDAEVAALAKARDAARARAEGLRAAMVKARIIALNDLNYGVHAANILGEALATDAGREVQAEPWNCHTCDGWLNNAANTSCFACGAKREILAGEKERGE